MAYYRKKNLFCQIYFELVEIFDRFVFYAIIPPVASTTARKGVKKQMLSNIVKSIIANVATHCICKWLDRLSSKHNRRRDD